MVTWGASEELFDAKYAVGSARWVPSGKVVRRKERPAVEPVSDQCRRNPSAHAPMPADVVRLMRLTGASWIELRRLTDRGNRSL